MTEEDQDKVAVLNVSSKARILKSPDAPKDTLQHVVHAVKAASLGIYSIHIPVSASVVLTSHLQFAAKLEQRSRTVKLPKKLQDVFLQSHRSLNPNNRMPSYNVISSSRT